MVDTINGKPSSLQLLVNPLIYNIHQKYNKRLRFPAGRRQTSWPCAIAAEALNQGLPETNPPP